MPPTSRAVASRSAPARQVLREAGLRCTQVRAAALACLSRAARPLSHAELTASREMEALDRVTVYRALSALQEARLVHRVLDREGIWRYCTHRRDPDHCAADHPHFQCTGCGRMRCLCDQSLPWVAVPGGVRVTSKQFVAYGLCASCVKRSSRPRRRARVEAARGDSRARRR